MPTATTIITMHALRDRWELHWDGCPTCMAGRRLCAEGRRLHSEYAAEKTRIERGR